MDLDAVTENADYYKRGYPADWEDGWTDAIGGYPHQPRGYAPAYEDGYRRGLADRNTQPTKESETSMANATVDLDALASGLDEESKPQETAAEASTKTTTSSGGFALLEGMEDELDKGSGKPWIAENTGDQLMGLIEGVDEVTSEYAKHESGRVPLLLIRDKDGELWSVRGFGTVLEGRLREIDAHVGDAIGIRFLGKEQPKNASYQAYNNWAVKLIRAAK